MLIFAALLNVKNARGYFTAENAENAEEMNYREYNLATQLVESILSLSINIATKKERALLELAPQP